MNARVRDPLVLLLAPALIAVFAVALRLARLPPAHAEQLTAVAVLLVFVTGVLLSSANGLVLLFLLPPLFNGEDQRPYFFLLEVLVYLTLATGFVTRLWRRRPLVFPHAPFFIFYVLSTVISLPLDLREMWLEIEVARRGARFGTAPSRASSPPKLFYVRTVLNVLSGIALYVLVVNERWVPGTVARLAVAVTAVSAGVTALGSLLYWVPVAPGATFLTVWLGGELTGGFTGLGFNVSYFAQYALAYLPLAGVVLVERAPHWAKALALAALVLTPYALLATYQRGAYVVLLVEFGLLALAGLSLRARTRPRIPLAVVGVAGGFFSRRSASSSSLQQARRRS